jgi:hypothetical protein
MDGYLNLKLVRQVYNSCSLSILIHFGMYGGCVNLKLIGQVWMDYKEIHLGFLFSSILVYMVII